MPSPRRNKKARASAPDPRSPKSPDNRTLLKSEEVCVGSIAWLPSYLMVNQVLKCRFTGEVLERNGYNHPVVILSVKQGVKSNIKGDLTVHIALLTSFHLAPLTHYISHATSAKYRHCIPIVALNSENGNAQADAALPLLHLETQIKLRKQSYVLLRHVYTVSISELRAYDFGHKNKAYQKRLDRESYHVLMNALNLPPEPFPPTSNFSAVSNARPEALVDSETTHLFQGNAERQQTIHQLPPHSTQLRPTPVDTLRPKSMLYNQAWSSFYRPDIGHFPTSSDRSYALMTSALPLLPPPVTSITTRNIQEKQLCTRFITSLIIPLVGVNSVAFVLGLFYYLYWSRE